MIWDFDRDGRRQKAWRMLPPTLSMSLLDDGDDICLYGTVYTRHARVDLRHNHLPSYLLAPSKEVVLDGGREGHIQ